MWLNFINTYNNRTDYLGLPFSFTVMYINVLYIND